MKVFIKVDTGAEPLEVTYKFNDVGIIFNEDAFIIDRKRLFKELNTHWHKKTGQALPADAEIIDIEIL